jgi:hypothetical protein
MTFPEIEREIEDIYRVEREMGFPHLYGMRQPVAFLVARKVIEQRAMTTPDERTRSLRWDHLSRGRG